MDKIKLLRNKKNAPLTLRYLFTRNISGASRIEEAVSITRLNVKMNKLKS